MNVPERKLEPKVFSKTEKYSEALGAIQSLLSEESDLICNLANTCAVLKSIFDFWWVGFYLVKGEELVLGPFQGPVACTRIPLGKGVCGTAWKTAQTLIVPDVDKFPGHIACSTESRSEIVVPLVKNQNVLMVLDIDSTSLNEFDTTDGKFLELIMQEIGNKI
jgi:L-methionine (R)-S-oxide reductase